MEIFINLFCIWGTKVNKNLTFSNTVANSQKSSVSDYSVFLFKQYLLLVRLSTYQNLRLDYVILETFYDTDKMSAFSLKCYNFKYYVNYAYYAINVNINNET